MRVVSIAAVVLVVALGTPAAATIAPNPVDLMESTQLSARITLVGTTTGLPAGALMMDGAVGASDVTLLFEVEYIASGISPLAFVQIARTGGWTGMGWVPGPNEDWSDFFSNSGFLGDTARFISDILFTGETSDVFFVSAASLAAGETLSFSFQGYHGVPYGTANASWVPEPATAALVAGGLALLGATRPRDVAR